MALEDARDSVEPMSLRHACRNDHDIGSTESRGRTVGSACIYPSPANGIQAKGILGISRRVYSGAGYSVLLLTLLVAQWTSVTRAR